MPTAAIAAPTRAQLGAANDPSAHAGAQNVDPRLAPAQPPTLADQPVSAARWRSAALHAGPGAGPATLYDRPAVLDSHELSVQSGQNVDSRRVWNSPDLAGNPATNPGGPSATADVRPVDTTAVLGRISDRPRAGLTSADGTRPAAMPHWIFTRPFDKIARYTLAGNKVLMPDPTAATPHTSTQPVAGAVASPGGSQPILGMPGRVGPQRNSGRVMPDPWDADVINIGSAASPQIPDPSAAVAAAAVAGGWRAR